MVDATNHLNRLRASRNPKFWEIAEYIEALRNENARLQYEVGKYQKVANQDIHDVFERAEKAEAERDALQKDYTSTVAKFDDCRGMLAFLYKQKTGKEPTPPDNYEGDWHVWLIDALAVTERGDG